MVVKKISIRLVFEQIGEGFGRFDLAVRTSFLLIFTLTPTSANPNRCFLSPWILQLHPCIAPGCSDHPLTLARGGISGLSSQVPGFVFYSVNFVHFHLLS